ncbi:MAG: SMC-Scp complex subunit ScpB [Candidatus Acidiferrales bacterium]|jgi:segregation and condensation protein B
MTPQEIQSSLEAIIYAADEPATLDQISKALGIEKSEARAALEQLTAAYQTDDRGIEVRKVAGGWKFYTKAQHHDVVRKFIKSLQPPLRLTMPALETLAVIAYKQPVTVPEINEIRGVHVGGVIKTLLEKRLITTAGRKEVIGRPILYRTSKQFMMRFGLSDLDELPSLKEFEALAQAALGSDEGIAEAQPEDSAAVGEEIIDAEVVNVEVVEAEVVAEAIASEAATLDDLSDDAASEAGTVPGNANDSISDASAEQEATSKTMPEDTDKSRAAAASSSSGNQSSGSET